MADASLLPRRIVKETQRLLSEPAPGISATPYQDNLRYFNVIIAGPQSSPYENGIFKLELFLPEEYPMAPPKVRPHLATDRRARPQTPPPPPHRSRFCSLAPPTRSGS